MAAIHMAFKISLRHQIGDCALAVDFSSNAGITAIIGPSGAGKSTLLNCIAGLIAPDQGRIAIADDVLFDSAKGICVPIQHRRAGYVFQDARIFPHLNVAANLAYGEKLSPPAAYKIERKLIIDVLGIAPLMDRWPATLSGGEMRRIAIARALLSAPKFLLLDEPLASLDRARGEEILAMIEHLHRTLAIPMLYVSHQPLEVERLTDSVIALGNQPLMHADPPC